MVGHFRGSSWHYLEALQTVVLQFLQNAIKVVRRSRQSESRKSCFELLQQPSDVLEASALLHEVTEEFDVWICPHHASTEEEELELNAMRQVHVMDVEDDAFEFTLKRDCGIESL